jgi:hypothetical protein
MAAPALCPATSMWNNPAGSASAMAPVHHLDCSSTRRWLRPLTPAHVRMTAFRPRPERNKIRLTNTR